MRSKSLVLRSLQMLTLSVASIVVLLGISGEASAATKTWDGSGNMSAAANWDNDTLPTDGDTILFNGTSTSNATWDSTFASSYSNLVVNVASGYTGTITLGASATFASSTIAAGTLNIAAQTLTTNGTMTIAGGVVTTTFGSGTHVLNGDLRANSGTYTPAATVTVKGNWYVTSASVTLDQAHTFAITFASTTGSQYFKPGSGVSYCGITINNTAGGSSDSVILQSDTLTTFCAVTITQGLLDFATNNIAWTQDNTVTIADNAQAGLSLGTPTYTFRNNINIGSSATLSTVSTTYVYEPQDAGQYYVTSTANHIFNGTFSVDMSCSSISTTTISGGLATTHLKHIDGVLDFRTNNATLDADGYVNIFAGGSSGCTQGTQVNFKWGTGQFNIGGNFIQNASSASVTAGANTFIFDGIYGQIVSSTATFNTVYIRKTGGSVWPGTGSSSGMSAWNVINMTVATGTLDFTVFNDPMIVADDFLVSGASTSIKLPNGSGNGLRFQGDVYMTAAGSFTPGTTTTTIATSTGSGAVTQRIGATAGTMSLGSLAVSTTLILPEGYSLTVSSLNATTSLAFFNLQGNATISLTTASTNKFVFSGTSNYSLSSSSTVVYAGSGSVGGAVMPTNVTLNSSGSTFTASASTTIMGNFTVASGTTLVISGGVDFTVPAAYTVSNSGTITQTGTFVRPNSYLYFVDSVGTPKTALTYGTGQALYVEVKDDDGNLDGTGAESMASNTNQIRLYSNTGDIESIAMTETGTATGIFRGNITIRTSNTPTVGDGTLDLYGNGSLSLAFVDATNTSDASTTTISIASQGATSSDTAVSGSSAVAGTVQINAGALTTESPTVTLQLSATNATEMAISDREDFAGGVWKPYATVSTFTFTSTLGAKTIYVKFADSQGRISAISTDTIQLVQTVAGGTPVTPVDSTPPTTPAPGVEIPFGLQVGDLVKIDGNSAVYYIDPSGTRRSFPTETVYASWYGKDFSKVKTVTAQQLASFSLGKNMTIKPGTYLVKITTVPKVYAITADATLQWVSSEERAVALYGAQWAKKVVDVPDAYFVDYTILQKEL